MKLLAATVSIHFRLSHSSDFTNLPTQSNSLFIELSARLLSLISTPLLALQDYIKSQTRIVYQATANQRNVSVIVALLTKQMSFNLQAMDQ
jgi:hypothetical protein